MVPHPLKLVVTGYSAALGLAVALHLWRGGWIEPALGFWLSGPVFVFAIGATPRFSRAFQRPAERRLEAEESPFRDERAAWLADLEADWAEGELRAWDRDLAEDSAHQQQAPPGVSRSPPAAGGGGPGPA
jgi:hypothetical protein